MMIATLAFAILARGQMQMDHGAGQNPPVTLRKGLGSVHHPVTTTNKKAQQFFDQGLALTYGFNHHAAIASFEEAARLDPHLAMAHWGIAYAMGPNINLPIDPDTNKQAFAEVQKAVALEDYASPAEREMINALAQRYSNDDKPDFDKLNTAYSKAMAQVVKDNPKDLDAATLYAESIMDLHPWRLWTIDGQPVEGTNTVISVLQGVLARNPDHIGANHFLIHTMEASPHPEVALESAHRLEHLAPQSGHLVHMPSHIYLRMGDWGRGLKSNEAALAVDRAFLEKTPNPGMYPMYYVHNFDMYRACSDMAGNYKEAQWGAQNVGEKAATMGPMGEPFAIVPVLEMVRFARWQDILAAPAPASQSPFVQAVYHYSRGMAFASTGDEENTQKEFDAFTDLRGKVPMDATWGLGPASQVLEVEADLLGARLARVKKAPDMEIDLLQKAVAAYDQIGYDEPADFYFPVREALGAALLRNGRSREALDVFAKEVQLHPNSGRALFGLWQAHKAEGHIHEADHAMRAYEKAWAHSDTSLAVDNM
jgi:tetratricopeptide (TPR) repeat protein